MYFCYICVGSTNDHLAYDFSSMKDVIENRLPDPYYCIADEGLTNSSKMLTPWPRSHLDEWKRAFNWGLSRMRQCIERSFSLLMERWPIFQRPLRCAMRRWTLVGLVGAKLHNFCIDNAEEIIVSRCPEDVLPSDDTVPIFNDTDPDDLPPRAHAARGYANTRHVLTEKHSNEGWRRPW